MAESAKGEGMEENMVGDERESGSTARCRSNARERSKSKVSKAFYYSFLYLLHWSEKPKRVFIEKGKRGFLQRKP